MDRNLARSLHILITPEVQEALNKLLEHRKKLNIEKMTKSDDKYDMTRGQGAIRELDWLLDCRNQIIAKAE